jgi:hypothetical protein
MKIKISLTYMILVLLWFGIFLLFRYITDSVWGLLLSIMMASIIVYILFDYLISKEVIS